ncbi:MAG: membrane dipeptidase [Litorimonas sp.]
MTAFRSALLLTAAAALAACADPGPEGPAPVAPGETVVEAPVEIDVAALHSRLLTLDTHIDIPLTYMIEIDPAGPTDLQVDQPKLEAGRLDSGFWIVYIPQGELTPEGYETALGIAETRMSAIERLTAEREDFELAVTAADVRRIVADGKFAVLVGMENAFPLAEDPASVADWAARGVRYVGLTHFGHNQFGDSSNPNLARDDGPRHGGLSELGRELVRELNDHGVMVDVSHTGKQTMMQAAELSRTPVIASHSGVKAVADSRRNLDDEQLRKIAEVGGVAQMVALGAYVKVPTPEQQAAREALDAEYEAFGTWSDWDDAVRDAYRARRSEIDALAPEADVSNFVDHIDHAVAVAGIDHVGIASDFDGGGGIDGWRDASETEAVTAELVRRGYDEAAIAKIWGGNLLRVLEAVEAAATE